MTIISFIAGLFAGFMVTIIVMNPQKSYDNGWDDAIEAMTEGDEDIEISEGDTGR